MSNKKDLSTSSIELIKLHCEAGTILEHMELFDDFIEINFTTEEKIHMIDLIEIHSSSLDDAEYRNFSDAQKKNIREFDSVIIEKLK